MTQEELGGLIGVTKQTMSGYEHDGSKPDADKIRKLCKVLECSSDYLLELTDDPNGHVKW